MTVLDFALRCHATPSSPLPHTLSLVFLSIPAITTGWWQGWHSLPMERRCSAPLLVVRWLCMTPLSSPILVSSYLVRRRFSVDHAQSCLQLWMPVFFFLLYTVFQPVGHVIMINCTKLASVKIFPKNLIRGAILTNLTITKRFLHYNRICMWLRVRVCIYVHFGTGTNAGHNGFVLGKDCVSCESCLSHVHVL